MLGCEHPTTLSTVNNLARLLQAKGDWVGAEALCCRTLEARANLLGCEHPETLTIVYNLAELLRVNGDLVGAEPLYRRALQTQERELGVGHLVTLRSVNNLAMLLSAKGDLASAEPFAARVVQGTFAEFGPEHEYTQSAQNTLAEIRRTLAEREPGSNTGSGVGERGVEICKRQRAWITSQRLRSGVAKRRCCRSQSLHHMSADASSLLKHRTVFLSKEVTQGVALASDIIANSRARYTRPRAHVEEAIARSFAGGKPEIDSIPRVVINRPTLNRRT